MIDVYFIDVNVPDDVIGALADLLTESERARAERYRFDADRRRSIIARAATRRILSRLIDTDPRSLEIVPGEHGKPAMAGGGIEFNASHSGDLVALALSRLTVVGIDVERIRPLHNPLRLARRFFSPEELAYVSGAENVSEAFFTVWTAKEAIVKTSGKGIGASDLRAFTVPLGGSGWARVADFWSVTAIAPPGSGYHAAIATTNADAGPIAPVSIDAASLT